jgi:pectin methylesterase-like acyl-CoA thioesterase
MGREPYASLADVHQLDFPDQTARALVAFLAALLPGASPAYCGCSDRGELLGTRDVPAPVEAGPAPDGALASAADSGTPPVEAGTLPVDSGATADGGVPQDAAVAAIVLVVAQDGGGDFTTVQAAIDSLPPTPAASVEIDVRAGTYREKVTIRGGGALLLVGDNPLTTVITSDQNAVDAGGTARSATATIGASDFVARNITFQNGAPQQTAAQAVAVYATGDRQQFSNCRFISFQDTIYLGKGSQYFRDCYIEGNDDYVIGGATAVFQSCTLYSSSGGVAVTAPNTDVATPYGFVFLGGALTAAASVASGSVALGRPWGAYGSTILVGTNLGAHILPAGWVPMPPNDLSLARFAEYRSSGPGAVLSMRASPSRQLSDTQAAAITVPAIFGGWVPSLSP